MTARQAEPERIESDRDGASGEAAPVEAILSGDELRVAGVDHRGLLQPLLASPEGPGRPAGDVVAASRWLAPVDGGVERVEVWGPLAETLSMVAAARTVVVVQAGSDLRYLFGGLGRTHQALELARLPGADPGDDRWRARRGRGSDLILAAVAELPGVTAAGAPGAPQDANGAGPPPAALLAGEAPAAATFDGVAATGPDQPLLQQRLTLTEVDGTGWLSIGARQGDGEALSLAPRTPGRLERAVLALLLGWPVRL